MRQFIVDLPSDTEPAVGDRLTLDREESHHLLGVLRGADDRDWCLVDGRGRRLTAALAERRGKRAEVEITGITVDEQEARPPRLELAVAVVKGRRFEWILEKAVELGVHRIVPLRCERGVIDPGAGRRDRWQSLLRAALKQSGRCLLPELAETAAVGALVSRPGTVLYFGALPGDAEGRRTPEATTCDAGTEGLALAVGPEGGWTPAERESLERAGAGAWDLGPHVLRTETAAVAGLYALQALRRRLQA